MSISTLLEGNVISSFPPPPPPLPSAEQHDATYFSIMKELTRVSIVDFMAL